MSEEIFEIYEFVKENNLETHCYDYENTGKQIIVFIGLAWVREFLELIAEQVPSCLDEGGYEIKITDGGYLGIDLMDMINQFCLDEESDKWFNRFKKYSSECC